jgi:hypothetical protein
MNARTMLNWKPQYTEQIFYLRDGEVETPWRMLVKRGAMSAVTPRAECITTLKHVRHAIIL